MKVERITVPPLIQNLAESMLNTSNRPNIRDNYRRTIVGIRDYCNEVLAAYEKQQSKRA